MSDLDFITELFCRIDDLMKNIEKHPLSKLYPSEIVTIAFLFALKGVSNRAFYRYLIKNWKSVFPNLPSRIRLFRLFVTHMEWTDHFLAEPTILGVIDTYGIELIHPIREGRSAKQIGKKGISNHRWIVGGKLCFVVNQYGLVVAWDCGTANVSDNTFQPLVKKYEDEMIILSDNAFHSAGGDPSNLKICPRGKWNSRMVVETVLSMLTLVCHFKKVMHRKWVYFQTRLGFTMALFNFLVQWNGLQPDEYGFVPLSIAQFSL
jgi:hypothetical protein